MGNTLLLRLEAPLQSWGERAQWSIRDSAPEPTKSGVIGLLGCALGIGDDRSLRELSEQLTMGVRVDKPGLRMIDYHTIGGGYDRPMLLNAQGKPKATSGVGHTEISLRTYLCDASFLVALVGSNALIERCANALNNPYWPYFLGRKSCPPSRPVFEAITQADGDDPLRQVLSAWQVPTELASEIAVGSTLRAVLERGPGDGMQRRDHLLSRSHRRFGPRYTRDAAIVVSADMLPEETA